jgi:hypothetical protein
MASGIINHVTVIVGSVKKICFDIECCSFGFVKQNIKNIRAILCKKLFKKVIAGESV